MIVIPPKGDYKKFSSDEEFEEKTREWGLNSTKTIKKEFWYKEKDEKHKVRIVGYEVHGTHNTLVIEFVNEHEPLLSCIHPAYLKEMQAAKFGKASYLSTSEEEEEEAEEEEIKPKKEQVSSKPVVALPEEKVSFTAKIAAFETKYNAFTEEDDKVVLYDDVTIMSEPNLVVGKAWSSYSKSLEKLDLSVGDVLSFEAKIVKKKFNKDVPYKINNPSKLVKV